MKEQLTKKEWINKTIDLIDKLFVIKDEKNKSVISKHLDKLYKAARQNGYDDGYCDGLGEGCDYNGIMYEEVRYELNEDNEPDYDKEIDYKWVLK